MVRAEAPYVERRVHPHLRRQLQRVRAAVTLHDLEGTNIPR